jgi:hypothetical protein
MGSEYDPEAWNDLFLMIGTSAGALVGLLFVVMSLHLDRVSELPDHNMRVTMEGTRNNAYHLLTVLVEAAVLLAPQPLSFMAIELIAINLFGLRLPFTIIRRYVGQRITISERGGFPTGLIVTIIVAYALGIAGGALVFVQPNWGLYVVAVSCMTKVVRSVLTAWMFMLATTRLRLSTATPAATDPTPAAS